MKTRYIILGLLGLGTLACTTNKLDVQNKQMVEMVFSASVENNPDTKTILQEDRNSIWWSPQDSIRVFSISDNTSGLFISTNYEPSEKTSFRGSIETVTGTIDDENAPGGFIAVYPSRFALGYDYTPGSVYLPLEQIAADNTFAKGMFPAVAKSENTSLSFYNICGGIVFTVDGEGIKSVILKGNNKETFAGEARVSFSTGIPSAQAYDAPDGTAITLKAPNGGTFTPGVRYFISVYPQTFEQGITMTFFKAAAKSEVTWTKPATIQRSRFLIIEHADAEAGDYEYAIPEEAYRDMDTLQATFDQNISSTAGIYVPTRTLFNFCSDEVYSAGGDYSDQEPKCLLNEFRYTNETGIIKEVYSRLYGIVDQSNSFIKKYKDDLPEIIGPARVMRAYAYMMLAIGWGTPPWLDHVLAADELPYNCDRDPDHSMTHEQLLEWCALECETAASILDERESPQDVQGAYKITKGFAQAVAGKAYVFAGNYDKAKSVLGEVIRSGKYALVPGERFWENFHIEGDGNEEKVYEPNFEYYPGRQAWGSDGYTMLSSWMESNALAWRSNAFARMPYSGYSGNIASTGGGWGGLGVREEFAEAIIANDSKDSYRVKATIIHIDDVIGGSMYGDATFDSMTKEAKLASTLVGIVVGGLYGQSFWLPFKQLIKESDTNAASGANIRWNNYTVMRYAEILLLYAEACIQAGDDAQALWAINQIQQRAGSKTISTSVDMDVLKREKQFELWFEGCRWFDLVRWGDTSGVEQAGKAIPVLYDKFTRAPKSTDENVTWENGSEENSRFYTVTTHGAIDAGLQVGYIPGKHNLFPYPAAELEKNPNLVQNPGW